MARERKEARPLCPELGAPGPEPYAQEDTSRCRGVRGEGRRPAFAAEDPRRPEEAGKGEQTGLSRVLFGRRDPGVLAV